ncbi:hypothetical protein [Nocardia carnea]|uniref:hypothetical protein n=1 Tax=Nocardia carnea TaxID=37328 RepID=UPI002454B506|nr:hypothetical protein [Nocardia carnea]
MNGTTDRETAETGELVIGVVADPDLPARLARDLAAGLPAALARHDPRLRCRVEVFDDPFEAMYPDLEYIIDKAARHVRDTDWDLALCLTDLPLRSDGRTVLASLELRHRVALIPLPALGGVRLRYRLRKLAAGIVPALRGSRTPPCGSTATMPRTAAELPGRELAARAPFRRVRVVDDGTDAVLVERDGPARFAGLLAGMVRANRPWRLFVGLSSALAGTLAGTAFGVLYSSIWQLATALGLLRLAGVVLAAITALSVWIIVGHNLWERKTTADHARDIRLRNAGTVVTVAFGAIVFFAVLFLFTSAAVGLVIPPAYLATVLGGPVHLGDYLTIAAMASALGTVAGAVGSGLEDDLTVRKATYGYRDQERRSWVDRRQGSPSD